jgi:hypothetical protein
LGLISSSMKLTPLWNDWSLAMESKSCLLEKPVLDSVPPKTQWLVVHGKHYLNNPHPESLKTSPLNYSVLVTSLGIRGNRLDKDQYSHCIIRQNAVTTWIGEKHKSRVRAQGLSKVFTSPDFLL